MTFAKLSAIIYAHLVYAIEVIGALIILAFLLDICMKMWSLMQDRAIANYRVQLRIAALKQLKRIAACETCKNNQPSGEDDGRCTACMTGQRCKWNGGCRG